MIFKMQNISHVDPPVNICCMFLNSFDKMSFFPLALFKLNACLFVGVEKKVAGVLVLDVIS